MYLLLLVVVLLCGGREVTGACQAEENGEFML